MSDGGYAERDVPQAVAEVELTDRADGAAAAGADPDIESDDDIDMSGMPTSGQITSGSYGSYEQLSPSKKPKKREPNMLEWFLQDPAKHYPLVIFLFCSLLALAYIPLFIFVPFWGYFITGLTCLLMSAYAIVIFRVDLRLRFDIPAVRQTNRALGREYRELDAMNARLQRGCSELSEREIKFRRINAEHKKHLENTRALQEKVEALSDEGTMDVVQLLRMNKRFLDLWVRNLEIRERHALETAKSLFNPKVTQKQFTEYLEALPFEYARKFRQLGKTFEEISDHSGMVDLDQITALMDEWVPEIAARGGSCDIS